MQHVCGAAYLGYHLSKIGKHHGHPWAISDFAGQLRSTATVDVLQVLNNVFATPFTLAADLVTLPIGVVNQGVGSIQQLLTISVYILDDITSGL